MNRCISRKKVYLTAEMAEDALIEARVKFDYADGRGPVGIYKCEDCGYYHLTSSGLMNPRLAQQFSEGKIQKQKQAEYWLSKIKRR